MFYVVAYSRFEILPSAKKIFAESANAARTSVLLFRNTRITVQRAVELKNVKRAQHLKRWDLALSCSRWGWPRLTAFSRATRRPCVALAVPHGAIATRCSWNPSTQTSVATWRPSMPAPCSQRNPFHSRPKSWWQKPRTSSRPTMVALIARGSPTTSSLSAPLLARSRASSTSTRLAAT